LEFLYDEVNRRKEQIPYLRHCYRVFRLHFAFSVISRLVAGQINQASGQKIPGEQDDIPVNVRGKVRFQTDPQIELFIKGILQGWVRCPFRFLYAPVSTSGSLFM